MLDSVKHLRLTRLRVVFDCTVLQDVPDSFPDGLDLANVACEADLQPVAARFMDAMPTLEYLFLDARGRTYAAPFGSEWQVDEDQTPHTWLSSRAWQLGVATVHGDGGASVPGPSGVDTPGLWTELSGEAAERIADQEELRVPRRGEVSSCIVYANWSCPSTYSTLDTAVAR